MSVRRPGYLLARWMLMRAQTTTRRGIGGFSAEAFNARGDERPFPQADFERNSVEEFFRLFHGVAVRESLRASDVLDFGSGYGGKTVEYRLRYGAKSVCGVEPFGNMVERSRDYARSRNVDGVEFRTCGHRDIPYPDASFDVVLSHDVLEHVEDPRASMAEIHRVLRPGGRSFNVFPVYFGAMSHHLDYVTTLPALHWLFSPAMLVEVVNDLLETTHAFGTAKQPPPRRSFDDAHDVLPGLNGLSGRHFATLFSRFEIVNLRRIALGPRGMGLVVRAPLPSIVRDLATATVVCALRKP